MQNLTQVKKSLNVSVNSLCWSKVLVLRNVNGEALKVIRAIYSNATSWVVNNGDNPIYLIVYVRLRQGEGDCHCYYFQFS